MQPKAPSLSETKLRLKLEKFNAIRTKYDSADSFRSHEAEHSVSVSKSRRHEEILTPSSILSGSGRRIIGHLAQSAPHSLSSQHHVVHNNQRNEQQQSQQQQSQHVASPRSVVHSPPSQHSSRARTDDSCSPSSSSTDSYSPHGRGNSPTFPRQSRSREISSSHSHSGHSQSHSGTDAEIGLDDGPGAGPRAAVVNARSHSSPSPGTSFSPYKRLNPTQTSSGGAEGAENKSRAGSASDDFYIVYSFKALMAKNTAQVAEAEAQEVLQREADARAQAAATEKREKERHGSEKKAKRKSLPATLMARSIFSSSSGAHASVKTNTNSNSSAHFRPNDIEDYLITPDGPLYTTQPSPNANVPPPSSSGKTRAKRSTSIKITTPSSPHSVNNSSNPAITTNATTGNKTSPDSYATTTTAHFASPPSQFIHSQGTISNFGEPTTIATSTAPNSNTTATVQFTQNSYIEDRERERERERDKDNDSIAKKGKRKGSLSTLTRLTSSQSPSNEPRDRDGNAANGITLEEFIDSRRVRRKSLSLQNFANLIGSNSSTNNNQPQVNHNPISWTDTMNAEDEKKKNKKEKRNSWKSRSAGNETNSNSGKESKNVNVYNSEHVTMNAEQQQFDETIEKEKREKVKKEKRSSWKQRNVPSILTTSDAEPTRKGIPREHDPNDETNFASTAHSPPRDNNNLLGVDSISPMPSDRDYHAPDESTATTTAATSTRTSFHRVREEGAKSTTDSVKFRDDDFLDSQKNTSEKFKKEKRGKRRSMPARLKTKNDATAEETSSYSFMSKFSPRNPDRVEISPHKLDSSPRVNSNNISPTRHKFLSVPNSTTSTPDKNQNQDQKTPRRNAWKRRSMPHHFKK